MKVRVVKPFLDAMHGNRARFEGLIYETSMERAAELTKAGFVKLLEPPKEYTLPDTEMETKKPGGTKGPRKSQGKGRDIAKKVANKKR